MTMICVSSFARKKVIIIIIIIIIITQQRFKLRFEYSKKMSI